ncbi:MAG: diacylglycerol kinase, partial [Patescibacteria group bacterium]|nr:diacylglycerol kinase [Patescibacteria group bacterium]
MSKNRFIKSLGAAGRGLKLAFKTEHNFRLQILLALVVMVLAFYFPLKNWEIILVVLLVAAVLVMELLNTALEYFTDLLKPRLHHYVSMI